MKVTSFWKTFAIPVKTSVSAPFFSKFIREFQCHMQFQNVVEGAPRAARPV